MKLTLEGLNAQLAERLLPIYLVSGDEPLLVAEATDAIRARARALAFTEREVFFIERSGAVWDDIRQAAQSLSLFSARRMIEIRMPGGKPGTAGAAVLLQLFEAAGEDLLVLIIAGKLERETQSSEWMQALQQRGAWLPIWPVERARLSQWLRSRFSAAGLTAAPDALALLAERSEGNLLAARQEIDKLAMLLPRGATVSVAEVAASSADSARFDVFQLGEAVRGARCRAGTAHPRRAAGRRRGTDAGAVVADCASCGRRNRACRPARAAARRGCRSPGWQRALAASIAWARD